MTYRWIDLGNGRRVWRNVVERVDNRSNFPVPMIAGDTIDPVQSMADGRYYTSKAAIRASYKASGNPQGVEYTEVGNDAGRFRERPQPRTDEKAINDSLNKAIARVEAGETT